MQSQAIVKCLILIALLFLVAAFVMHFFGDKLGWIGNLPGDIRIEKENFKVYFPITTMIILSVIVNVIIKLISKF